MNFEARMVFSLFTGNGYFLVLEAGTTSALLRPKFFKDFSKKVTEPFFCEWICVAQAIHQIDRSEERLAIRISMNLKYQKPVECEDEWILSFH